MFKNSFLDRSNNRKNWSWRPYSGCGWCCFIFNCHTFEFSFSSCIWSDKRKKINKMETDLSLLTSYLAGLKFSFSESDSKFPNTFACLDFNDSLCSWRSSESLNVGFTPPSMLLYASAGLLLSSVGWGAQATIYIFNEFYLNGQRIWFECCKEKVPNFWSAWSPILDRLD